MPYASDYEDEEYPCPYCGLLSWISEYDPDDMCYRMRCNGGHTWFLDDDESDYQ